MGGTKTVPLCFECHSKVHNPASSLAVVKMSRIQKCRKTKLKPEDYGKVWSWRGKMSSRDAAEKLGYVSHMIVYRFWNGQSPAFRNFNRMRKELGLSQVRASKKRSKQG